MVKNTLVRNTLILILSSLLIKIMGLANRIILTRILGNEGISLYMLILPSVMLFISLGSLSLNLTITKIVAVKKSGNVIKKGIKIAIYSSLIMSLVLLIIIKPLSYSWLKQPKTFYPILLTIPLIFLSAFNSVLRGYYNGIKKVNITSSSILIEQIVRISISVFLLLEFHSYGIEVAVSLAIIAMSIGEVGSIIFAAYKIKKYKPISNEKVNSKEILDIAIPLSFSRLLGNITFFLEPIIFTLSLTILHYDNKSIMYKYSEVNAYAIPLITMFSFVSSAIATAIIPHVAASTKKQIPYYITSSLMYAFLPAIPITLILTTYAGEYMKLIYDTQIGVKEVRTYTFFFILFYLHAPLISIMQAANHTKSTLIILAIADIIKLTLIFSLPFIIKDGLIIALLISSTFSCLSIYFYLKRKYHFKLDSHIIINVCLVALICTLFLIILKVGNVNYLLASTLLILVFLLTIQYLGLFRFSNK